MGMTIDTVDKWLKIQRQNLVDSSESARDKKIESLDTAVSYLEDYQELMRKYQKIEEILDDDSYYENHGNNAEGFIVSAISEVLKDGEKND